MAVHKDSHAAEDGSFTTADDEPFTLHGSGENGADVTRPAGEWAAEAKDPHIASSEW